MRNRTDGLERVLREVTAALATLQRAVPELVAEARRHGGEEVRRRILDAAAVSESASEAVSPPAPRRRAAIGVGKLRRGFITPAIQRILDRAGTRGMKRNELFHAVEQESEVSVRRDSYKMALLRLTASSEIVDIDDTIFLAKHAEEATAGQEGAEEPSEPAPTERSDLWSLRNRNAAA